MLPGEECWAPMTPAASRTMPAPHGNLRRASPHACQHFLPLSDAGEGDLDAPLVPSLAPVLIQKRGQQDVLVIKVIPGNLQATDEVASVENRWRQLRDTVQFTALNVLGCGRRQHQDWFDVNVAAINTLLAEKNRLHKAYVDRLTDTNKTL
ncbi:unnamed protein product [Schistocephalus solidus]|uniref:BLOC-1-related complex subunit 5 n=1 Tax=Schistocephalus solidus TaxID=70667 RepID=A0A183T4A3_SCHSO|nr:unnamed protein product [Schistocephalus solidus]